MKKSLLIILVIIILILFLAVGLLLFNYLKPKLPINGNLNQISQADFCQQQRQTLEEKDLFLPAVGFNSILNFYGFCQFKKDPQSLFSLCDKLVGKIESTVDPARGTHADTTVAKAHICKLEVGYLSMLYFSKKDDRKNFNQICQEFKELRPAVSNCDLAWDNFKNIQEFCDASDYNCAVLASEESKARCTNIINLSTITIDQVQTENCQKEISFRKAANAADCQQIKDDLTRYTCLALYSDDPCNNLSSAFDFSCRFIDTKKVKDFISQNGLKACCYADYDPEIAFQVANYFKNEESEDASYNPGQ